MELSEFRQNFIGYDLTSEFIDLKHFQDKHLSYSDGFYLLVDAKTGIKTWSEDKNFLDRLMPFAQANGSGSTYGIWDDGANKKLNELPIVVFGDEGGVHIVAENISQLMQLLTFDTEIMVDFDQASFYKDEDNYEESKENFSYKNWLKKTYKLDSIIDPNKIIEDAQIRHKAAFDNWFRQYYKDE